MFEYHVCAGRGGLHRVIDPFQNVYAACIVRRELRIVVRYFLGQSLCEVKAESIYLVFLQPEISNAVNKIFGGGSFMVKIISKSDRGMRSYWIEPWIVRSGTVVEIIPIHSYHRRLFIRMVDHKVHDHRDTVAMTRIYQFFQAVLRSIVFIRSKIERGVVSPTVVTLELIYGHEFNSIYT